MSDTPRTDCAARMRILLGGASVYVTADFARQLERELNQAIKERDENKAGWDNASLVALRLERERNEARECLREKLFDCVANQKSLTGYEPAGPATVYLEPRCGK